MSRVLTYGTFDMFHIGHLNLLRRVSQMGHSVVVGVSTDEFNAVKGKKTLIPYEQRASIVQAVRYVDSVIPENNWEQKRSDIEEHGIDLFVIGDDWRGQFDHLEAFCEVKYLPRTSGVSTSQLKKALNAFHDISTDDLVAAFDILERLRKELV